jgi:hypothetical protein
MLDEYTDTVIVLIVCMDGPIIIIYKFNLSCARRLFIITVYHVSGESMALNAIIITLWMAIDLQTNDECETPCSWTNKGCLELDSVVCRPSQAVVRPLLPRAGVYIACRAATPAAAAGSTRSIHITPIRSLYQQITSY